MGELGSIWIRIGAKIDDFERGMSDAEKALKKVGQKFSDIGKSVSIAGAAIVGSMGLAIQKTATFGDELDEMSERTGVSVSVLSSLKLAADKSGTSLGGLAQGMKFLSMSMVETAKATDKSKTELGALGINVKDAAGNMRPLNDVMLDVAERFKDMPDGAQKTALAVKIFGRAGTELIPVLNMGRDGLQAQMDMAQKYGIVLSEDAANACAKFKDAQVDLKAATQGLGMQISTQLIPTLTSLTSGISGIIAGVTSWAKAHPGLSQAISTTTLAIGGVLTASGSFLMIIGTLAQKLVFLANTLGTTIAKLSLSISAFTAAALAVGYYAVKLGELKKAEDYVIEADNRLQQTENQLIDKLSKAATAAGWQYGAMAKLITAYDGNVVALTQAIRAGKHGIEIQEALVRVGKEHAATVEEEKKKLLEADPIMAGINKLLSDTKIKTDAAKVATQDWIGFLSTSAIKTIQEKAIRTQELNSILGKLEQALRDGKISLWDYSKAVAIAREEIKSLSAEINYDLIPSTRNIETTLAELPAAYQNLATQGTSSLQILSDGAAKTTADTKNYFDGLFNDIASGFGNTIQKWMEGATTFKDFMKSIWEDIKSAFFRMIGEMVAAWAVNLVKKLISGIADVATSITSTLGPAVGSIGQAAGGIASSLLSGLGAIGGIVSGIGAVISALSPAKKQGDVTYWLKFINDNVQNIWNTMTWLPNTFDTMNQQLQTLKEIGWAAGGKFVSINTQITKFRSEAVNYLKQIASSAKEIVAAINGLPHAQSGAIVTKPSLVNVGERGPEAIVPLSQISGAGLQQVKVEIQPIVIPRGDSYVIEFLQKKIEHGNIRIPITAVG